MNRQESAVRLFLRTRRSDATRELHRRTLRLVLSGRPDAFLRLAERDSPKAERALIRFFMRRRKTAASATLAGYLYCVRSFLAFNGVSLRWGRIKQVIPRLKRRGEDRPPTAREIRRLLAKADHRLRAAALMMASSGMRVGAFWFPKSSGGYGFMRVRDVSFRESGVTAVKVYPGEAEEYPAFISDEAATALRRYWRLRRRRGERLGPWSPVLAVEKERPIPSWMRKHPGRYPKDQAGMAAALTVDGVQSLFAMAWKSSGVVGPERPMVFKSCHGFRKWFETEAKRGVGTRLGSWRGVDDRIVAEDVELLLGHHSSYHRPSLARLEAVYLRLQPLLLIRRRLGATAVGERPTEEIDEALPVLRRELRKHGSKIADINRKLDDLTELVERLVTIAPVRTK